MSHEILIVTESELKRTLKLGRSVNDLVEKAFAALATGEVIMPPILSMDLPMVNAEVDVKTAYIPDFEHFAIKVSPGFFDNPKLGLPSLNGLMMLLSAQTGLASAVFLDNGYLTDLRTAAAGGVAARHLAPQKVETAGVFGTGVQARLQIIAAHIERPFKKVLVWGRNRDHAEACAQDIAAEIGVEATAVDSAERVVKESQLVVTTTPSREPLIDADWMHPDLHITAMGSDQEGKNELDPEIAAQADLYVCDRVSQCELLGELRTAKQTGNWPSDQTPPELGQIITGGAAGRTSDATITICDLTGTGAQDTAIGNHALELAYSLNFGTKIKTD
ncbi:ornithine cyclodeaminase [Maritalea myrionectae]|uniref:Ornithine cyclodeaminase n=1 Tax=Maritalea myrionectae TaxID=454601 RepID=A0A2R4MIN0_9HYPH|nr:cyclodeaminase [Maritalea myrionectae]AVX05872.1 ornithine cyclodeaminase [Maritalea myrionectae]